MTKKFIPLYKGGVDTPIANKHFWGFQKRFNEENAKVLQEAREEMERIQKKRKANRVSRITRQRMRNLIPTTEKV